MDIKDLIITIVASIGGVGVIIIGLAAWLGQLLASRLQVSFQDRLEIEREFRKSTLDRELETLKAALELNRNRQERISEAQFQFFTDIWNKLQELKFEGNQLWERATETTLFNFITALTHARLATEKARLVISEEDYQNLDRVLTVFENFRVGKARLIQIRTKDDWRNHSEMRYEESLYQIHRQIRNNGIAKKQYEKLLDELAQEFRQQLSLSILPRLSDDAATPRS